MTEIPKDIEEKARRLMHGVFSAHNMYNHKAALRLIVEALLNERALSQADAAERSIHSQALPISKSKATKDETA